MNIKKLERDYGSVRWCGRKRVMGMPLSFTRYIITNDKLITKIGFFNIKEDEIQLYRVIDKSMRFPLGQRIFGCGTIIVNSKDTDSPVKELKSIKRPREVQRILDELIAEERAKYRVMGRDMVGAAGMPGECDHEHFDDADEPII